MRQKNSNILKYRCLSTHIQFNKERKQRELLLSKYTYYHILQQVFNTLFNVVFIYHNECL